MKLTFKSNITILAAAFAIATQASATTIFTDTFDSGTGNWYKAYNNGTPPCESHQSELAALLSLNRTVRR